MFTVQRIYAYQPDSKQTAVFIDRLYPRGVHKEVFATALWLKDITPSANLRRWFCQPLSRRVVWRYRAGSHQAAAGFGKTARQYFIADRRQRPSTFPRLRTGSIFGHNV